MRRAIIRSSEPAKEEPIQYSLAQGTDYVALEATVGGLTQVLLILFPNRIRKASWVSNEIGLPTGGTYKTVVVEE